MAAAPGPLSRFVRRHARLIQRTAARHGAARVRVFGSHAVGKAGKSSDLDLLVKFRPGRDLFDLIDIKHELEDRLGCKVDVVSERGLSPYLERRILDEARPI